MLDIKNDFEELENFNKKVFYESCEMGLIQLNKTNSDSISIIISKIHLMEILNDL